MLRVFYSVSTTQNDARKKDNKRSPPALAIEWRLGRAQKGGETGEQKEKKNPTTTDTAHTSVVI